VTGIGTFAGFKDWLLLAILGALFTVLGMLHAGAVHRITIVEAKQEGSWARIEAHAARLATIEAIQNSQRDETFRRLDRIERKLDVIRGD
jgi:hypothetical protein